MNSSNWKPIFIRRILLILFLCVNYSSTFEIPDIDLLATLPGEKLKEQVSIERVKTDDEYTEFMSKSVNEKMSMIVWN